MSVEKRVAWPLAERFRPQSDRAEESSLPVQLAPQNNQKLKFVAAGRHLLDADGTGLSGVIDAANVDYRIQARLYNEIREQGIADAADWARNSRNIGDVPGSREGGQGVYVLYDGSTPVYVGRGNIRQRLRAADQSTRRGNSWDHFSWYVVRDKSLIRDVEVLLIRILPLYFRYLTRQQGNFRGVRPRKQNNRVPKEIVLPKLLRASK